MNLAKTLLPLAVCFAAYLTPSYAQVHWSNRSPAGVTDDIWCITYGDNTFAAVTNQGNLLTSTDGQNWTSRAIDQGVWLVSVAYGNGSWVVVGDKGTILVSPDLKTWNSIKPVTANKLNGVLYNGTVFVAVGDGGTILSSPDAKNWMGQATSFTGFLHGITYDPTTRFTVISGEGGALMVLYSNAMGPYLIDSRTSQNLEAVLCEGSKPAGTVTVGANGTIGYNPDGPPIYDRLALGFFATTWASVAVPSTTATFRGLTEGGGTLVAAGDHGTILTSVDGTNWTKRFSGDSPSTLSTATLLSAAYSETLQRFVVTGTGGTILVSNSTPTVFANVSTRGIVSSAQTFIGGFVIEGSSPRTVLVRADGPTLSAFSVSDPLTDPVLTVYDSKGNVVASNAGWTTNADPAAISKAAQKVGAFALPNPSADSALLLSLPPGAYTAHITSVKGASGNVLFEAYTY